MAITVSLSCTRNSLLTSISRPASRIVGQATVSLGRLEAAERLAGLIFDPPKMIGP